jgi:membrane associated rhomboid family serine protease
MKLFPTSPRNGSQHQRMGEDPPPAGYGSHLDGSSQEDVTVTQKEAPGYRAKDMYRNDKGQTAAAISPTNRFSRNNNFDQSTPRSRGRSRSTTGRKDSSRTASSTSREVVGFEASSPRSQAMSSPRSQMGSPTSPASGDNSLRHVSGTTVKISNHRHLQVDTAVSTSPRQAAQVDTTTKSPHHFAEVALSPRSQMLTPRSRALSPRSKDAILSTRSRTLSPGRKAAVSPRSNQAITSSPTKAVKSPQAIPFDETPSDNVVTPASKKQISHTRDTASPRSPSKSRRLFGLGSTKKEPLLRDDREKATVASPFTETRKAPLGGDDTKQVPMYQPPMIPEPDSFDSREDDRYAAVGPTESLVNSPPPEEVLSSTHGGTNSPLVKSVQQQRQRRRSLETFDDERDDVDADYDDDETYDDTTRKSSYPTHALSQMSSYFSNQSTNNLEGRGERAFAREPVLSAMSHDTAQSYFEDRSTMASYRPKDAMSQSVDFRSFGDFESGQFVSSDGDVYSEDGFILVKQRVAYLCMVLSACQLGIVLIQLSLCGMASLKINPMIGPYPDAFSEWGGKNVYLLLEEKQYYRIVTPVFLHVGILHFIVNAYCQLETCAYFEREWGSTRWLLIYLISGIGSVLTSSAIDPDLIGVCSSGALMGMFGAKIAQVLTWTTFDLRHHILEQSVQLDQLGGVMCSAAMISLLSFLTYVDWSGHLGGLLAGFLAGIAFFAKPIADVFIRVLFTSIGLFGLLFAGGYLVGILLTKTTPDEELGDACQYFRALYPEGYNCDCVWG